MQFSNSERQSLTGASPPQVQKYKVASLDFERVINHHSIQNIRKKIPVGTSAQRRYREWCPQSSSLYTKIKGAKLATRVYWTDGDTLGAHSSGKPSDMPNIHRVGHLHKSNGLLEVFHFTFTCSRLGTFRPEQISSVSDISIDKSKLGIA